MICAKGGLVMSEFDFDDRDLFPSEPAPERPRRDPREEQQRRERIRRRKRKLLIRRTLIVTVGVLVVALAILLLVKVGQTIMGQGGKPATADEASVAEPVDKYAAAKVFNAPEIAEDKKAKGHDSPYTDGIYIYNNAAYEIFKPEDYAAQNYANSISEFKRKNPKVTVYNILVPTHTEFGLPASVKESIGTYSQADYIGKVFDGYDADVIPINCYNKLSEHVKEYNYFGTDNHWTALGAYYGYMAFCEQSGNRTLNLNVCESHSINGYEGGLVYADDSLMSYLDTVYFWTFPYDTYAERTDSMGEEPYQTTVYYEGESGGPYAYGVFIWNSCALFVEHNEALNNGKKIAVVKDSNGNPFVPYLTANYEEVHVIDYDYYTGKLTEYLKSNNIDTVLILNSVSSSADSDEVVKLRNLF